MESNVTIQMTDAGRTVTYSKDLGEEGVHTDALFEAYLEAYETFTYQNDVDVIIRNSFLGDSLVSWTKENGVKTSQAVADSAEGYGGDGFVDDLARVLRAVMPSYLWMDAVAENEEGSKEDLVIGAVLNLVEDHDKLIEAIDEFIDDKYGELPVKKEGIEEEKWYMGNKYKV